jgi:hypothetical protein
MSALQALDGGKELAANTKYLLGTHRITRFLKKSQDYGKLDLLTATFIPPVPAKDQTKPTPGKLQHAEKPHWDDTTFANRCAGCHATAVTTKTRAFSALSLDCFTCHGDVPLEHTKDVSRVLLSSKNREPRQIVSTCGQCHLRGGKSKSTGLPYPNTFVAGDNLFRDFEVDFSDKALESQPAIDQHIWLSARETVVAGRKDMHCVTCHSVHGKSTEKHAALKSEAICALCHVPGTDNSQIHDGLLPAARRIEHSRVCDY